MEASVTINLPIYDMHIAETSAEKPIKKLSDFSNISTICRICHESDKNRNSKSDLISPCKCKGTMAYVHPHCIQRWASLTSNTNCGVCGFSYESKKSHPSIFAWLKAMFKQKINHKIEFILLLSIAISVLFIIFLTLILTLVNSVNSNTFMFKLSFYLVLIMITVFWLIYSMRYLYKAFRNWCKNNMNIELVFEKS